MLVCCTDMHTYKMHKIKRNFKTKDAAESCVLARLGCFPVKSSNREAGKTGHPGRLVLEGETSSLPQLPQFSCVDEVHLGDCSLTGPKEHQNTHPEEPSHRGRIQRELGLMDSGVLAAWGEADCGRCVAAISGYSLPHLSTQG